MSRKFYWIMLIAFAYALWLYVFKPTPNLADLPQGVKINEQVEKRGKYTITDLQGYAGEFRILSREDYTFGKEAELSPVDFAVGWGAMAKPEVYKKRGCTR